MKKIIIISILLLTALFYACDDFLNVSADNEVLQEEMFDSYKGVRMAVNGVYKGLSSTDLYGKNLSWGFVSALGHNYMSTSTTYLPSALYYGASFTWENLYVQGVTSAIWEKAYNVIASCNNIIQEVEKKDTTFFEIGSIEKNMILGEMYAVRALLHFDLLRLFCPAPITGREGKMPYVDTYPTYQPAHKTSSLVMADIIRDMELAREILAPIDTVYCRSWVTSTSSRFRHVSSWSNAPPNDFFAYRGSRMNYFGVTALLARMYMYNQDTQKALEHATKAYSFHTRNWFRWTSSSYQGLIADVSYIYTKRYDELYLAFSNSLNYDNWETAIGTSTYLFRMKNMAQLFGDDTDDYRLVGFYNRYGNQRYVTWIRPGTSSTAVGVANNQGPLLPIIRISEIYHILMELYIKEGKKNEALALFKTLRTSRGAKASIDPNISLEELMDRLVLDMVKESLTEGQTFFIFKRLNRDIYNGTTNIKMEPDNWVIPLPDSEIAYQFN